MTKRLTPDTILQLRRNDPEVKDLWVRFEPDRDFAALRDVDWEKDGACISNNSQLETLSIYGSSSLRRSTSFQNAAAAFFEAVARNTSITTLELNYGCPIMFESLAPRFGNGLRKLQIINTTIEASDIRLFISALEKCGSLGSTLEHIEIGCCSTRSCDELAGQLIDAFNDYCSLIKLIWKWDNGIGLCNVSIQALARLLNNPNCVLEELDLGDSCNSSEVDTFDSAELANALANYKKLNRLDLGGNDWFGENEWTQIFQSLQSSSCVLEDLCFKEAMNVPSALFGALSNNTSLKEIDLSYIEGISTEMWLSLADSLRGMQLEKIHLRGNQEDDWEDRIVATEINGTVVASFAHLVIDNTTLQELCFGGNHDVGDEVALLFADALTKNRTLTVLGFDPILGHDDDTDTKFYRDKITHVGWEAMRLALCNGSSIDATFKSNHVLQKVGEERGWKQDDMKEEEKLPKYLQDFLQLNGSDLSKFDVAREKILLTHFNNEHSNKMKIFDEDNMDWQVIPHAIAWMLRAEGEDEWGQTVFYWMLRSFPSLLSSSEKNKKVASGTKRKLVVE